MARPMELAHILIRGAREHNLRSIDVKIPKKKLVVLTGVSGSGKSSLAFDTLYADGQRRYVESLSAYARQFLGQMEKPKYDSIRGLSPTISIEQKTTGSNPRSTVGTITEISDYLRVLYARVGTQHCHQCGQPVRSQTAQQIARELLSAPDEDPAADPLAPLLVNRKGEHRELLAETRRAGFVRIRVDGEIVLVEDVEALDKRRKHTDRSRRRPRRGQEQHHFPRDGLGGNGAPNRAGHVDRVDQPRARPRVLGEDGVQPTAAFPFPSSRRKGFSFNSPQGMCVDCNGLGTRVEIDPRAGRSRRVAVDRRGRGQALGTQRLGEEQAGTTGYRAVRSVPSDGRRHGPPLAQAAEAPAGNPALRLRRSRIHQVKWEDEFRRGNVFDLPWEGGDPAPDAAFSPDELPSAQSAGSDSGSATPSARAVDGQRLAARERGRTTGRRESASAAASSRCRR